MSSDADAYACLEKDVEVGALDAKAKRPVDLSTDGFMRDTGPEVRSPRDVGDADCSGFDGRIDGDEAGDVRQLDCEDWHARARRQLEHDRQWPIPEGSFGNRVETFVDLKLARREGGPLIECANRWADRQPSKVSRYLWEGIRVGRSESVRADLNLVLVGGVLRPEALPYMEKVALLDLPNEKREYNISFRYHFGLLGTFKQDYRHSGRTRGLAALERVFRHHSSEPIQYQAAFELNSKPVGYSVAQLYAIADDVETRRIVDRLRCDDRPSRKFEPVEF